MICTSERDVNMLRGAYKRAFRGRTGMLGGQKIELVVTTRQQTAAGASVDGVVIVTDKEIHVGISTLGMAGGHSVARGRPHGLDVVDERAGVTTVRIGGFNDARFTLEQADAAMLGNVLS